MSCETEKFTGSGNVISITRDLEDFTAIVANNALEINIVHGPVQQVELMVNDNLEDRFLTQVNDGTLVVSIASGSYDNATFRVNVQVPDLNRVQFNDATVGNLDYETDQFELIAKDASDVNMQGTADQLTIRMEDAAFVSGFSFVSTIVNVTAEDAATLEITCNETLNGEVRDAVEVVFKGNHELLVSMSSAGTITDAN